MSHYTKVHIKSPDIIRKEQESSGVEKEEKMINTYTAVDEMASDLIQLS